MQRGLLQRLWVVKNIEIRSKIRIIYMNEKIKIINKSHWIDLAEANTFSQAPWTLGPT